MPYSVLSLFCGGGGLDLGFEAAGFHHLEAIDIDPWSIRTLKKNRPSWSAIESDVREYDPTFKGGIDVLTAGVPCQGFSLGGNRNPEDERNTLFREVVRLARKLNPRVVLIENVLNLRTMKVPGTDQPFSEHIAESLRKIGYWVAYDVFKVCNYGVPQTRRRFAFVGIRGEPPVGYRLPVAGPTTPIKPFLHDLGQGIAGKLSNHEPKWGFKSAVHEETGTPFDPKEKAIPVRFSRTASDGNPIRSFDEPFPAIDTATVWGWAQGNVRAARFEKDRSKEKYIRNPDATVALWRVQASRLRTFTHREYARLQTFPDDWEFVGPNKRSIHLQVGNAVPVKFATVLAENIKAALVALDTGRPFAAGDQTAGLQLRLLA